MTKRIPSLRLEVECLVHHLNDSSSRREGVECLARHLEDDRGQERDNFLKKGVRAVNRPATMTGGDGFGVS